MVTFRNVFSKCFVVLWASLVIVRADYDQSTDWDDQDPDLTEEIKRLTDRPHPYLKTPPGYFPCTEVKPPERFYDEEYKDKPCQDRAEWKIEAKATNNVFNAKDEPREIVDKIKISKLNDEYKVEQEIEPKGLEKYTMHIGDVQVDVKEKPKDIVAHNDDEQINLKDMEEGKKVPIGDDVAANDIAQENLPIRDDLKAIENTPKEQEDRNNNEPKHIGDNVNFYVDRIPNTANNSEQINIKKAINAVKDESNDANKNKADQNLYAIVNAINPAMKMRDLYNIAGEADLNNQINIENNVHKSKVENVERADHKEEENNNYQYEKTKIGKPISDIQIKIKLETMDDPKEKIDSLSGLSSLLNIGRKSMGGLDQFQSMVNKMVPLAQNVLNSQTLDGKQKPQNFYMKYLQIDPSANGLQCQYYYFQKYVNSRFKSKSLESAKPSDSIKSKDSQESPLKPNLLMSKLLSQILSPMSLLSPLTLLSPLSINNPLSVSNPLSLSNRANVPMRIYMNAKSAAKYAKNLDQIDGLAKSVNSRVKREEKGKETTEMPFFNEGPFKVEDPEHLKWAKNFIKEFPKEERPTTFHVIFQQPETEDYMQWYHPQKEATYYTIVPTVTRKIKPDEPVDLCECCHGGTLPTPATLNDECVFRVGDKDPFYGDKEK